MKNILNAIINNNLEKELMCGTWGLEKENIRVDDQGKLALTKHPEALGDKIDHPFITTDFSESQVEIITSPKNSMDEAYYMLENLHDIVSENLNENEYLWPSSMPPIIPCDDEIPIADYGTSEEAKEKMEYREFIAKKYGKHKQLICGIHYNFSFRDEFIKKLHGLCEPDKSYYDFKNSIYLTISRNLLKHQWLLTYLLGANVATHTSYKHCCNMDRVKKDEEYIFKGACSYRNSLCGYRNKEDFRVSFDTLEENIKDLRDLIKNGDLRGVNEYYSPVRLKNTKDKNSLEALEKDGIEYIELRMIDLNPLSKIGIEREDLSLVHLIILSSLLYPCSSYNREEQNQAIINQNIVSFNGHNLTDELKEEGLFFFDRMSKVLKDLNIDCGYYNKIIQKAKNQLSGKEELYSHKVYTKVSKEGYIDHHLSISKKNRDESINRSYSLKGYEDLELSTQILLKEALLKGLTTITLLSITLDYFSIPMESVFLILLVADILIEPIRVLLTVVINLICTSILGKSHTYIPEEVELGVVMQNLPDNINLRTYFRDLEEEIPLIDQDKTELISAVFPNATFKKYKNWDLIEELWNSYEVNLVIGEKDLIRNISKDISDDSKFVVLKPRI